MLHRITNAFLYSSSFKHLGTILVIKYVLFIILFSLFPISRTFSRIKNNFENKIHKIKSENASNISAISDKKGGVYYIWQESKSPMESKVYFTHVNLNQEFPGEIIGRNVSELSLIQKDPKSISYILNDAILSWKDYSNNFIGNLFMQRISEDQLLWGENSVRVTNSTEQILNYSLNTDNAGNIFVSYITRSEYPSNDYKILYQRVLSDGSLTYKNEALLVESSVRKKNNLRIVHDNNGGAFILWTEKINNNELILLKKVDPSGKSVLGNKPIKISGTLQNTIRYSESLINNSLLYVVWETQDKNIYHQLVNNKGKALWTVGGTKAAASKGANINPQVIQYDSLVTLSWLNNFNKDQSLFVQKFKLNGKEVWKGIGVPVTGGKNNITNYSLSTDGYGGIFVAWNSSTQTQNKCNISVQRVSDRGKLLWDSLGISSTFVSGCIQNYISVFAALNEQAVVSYENPLGVIMIENFQKPQIDDEDFIRLSSEIQGKSIFLKMKTNVEDERFILIVERLAHSDTSANVWEYVGSVEASPSDKTAEHELIDNPSEFGTLYYRSILKSDSKELVSNISRIDYLEADTKIIVAQNNPNPFSDSTIISFYLPFSSSVGFEFFNERAEKIGEFSQKEFPAGESSVTFYAAGLQPGIYFYKLFTKYFVEVKKMVID